jgi:2-keto-4-pentenoate hydratase
MTPVSYIQPHDIKTVYFGGGAGLNNSNASIAEQFTNARLLGVSIPAYPGTVPADLATAYQVQHLAIERWPDRIVGWKVARIGPQSQAQYPEPRLIGPVFARNVYVVAPREIAECPIIPGGFAAVEAEIGLYVRADAPAGKTDWTADQAADLVASLCIGVEVASSPLATLNDLGPGAVISDFGNNWGVVIGATITDWRTRTKGLDVETFIDGKSVGKGTIAIPQTPLDAFAFALNKAAQLGRPLRAGAYLSTGMITGVHDIRVGAQSRLVFGEYGELQCRTVAAKGYVETDK